jgi:hypothetical protein
MYNMRVQRRQSRKRSCRRNRKQYGAGAGLSYSFAGSIDPKNPSIGNGAMVVPVSSCGNVVSNTRIANSGTMSGIPGFGNRQYGGSKSMSDPIDMMLKMAGQVGGGYTSTPIGGVNPFMDRQYSGCGEGAFYKQSIPTTITAPPPLKGGAAVDAMIYNAPRSGYTFSPSNSSGGSAGTLSDGKVPFSVAVPYSAQPSVSPACLKTGGRRRNSRKNYRKKMNRRSSRKNTRKSRNN